MATVEELKLASRFLRGDIAQQLDSGADHFSDGATNLIKFHGMYQEDDRDQRMARQKAKLEPAYILMIRCRIPGGEVTARQYLELDKLADDCANGTLRITTRQGVQYHGVLMKNARELVQRINACELTTWNTCGDVNRNTMACPAPYHTPQHREAQQLAYDIAEALAARRHSYFEIWMNGKKVDRGPLKEEGPDPLYGSVYLPRKFKTGIAVPPSNDIDVFTQDLGFIPHFPNGPVEGYTVLVGGGLGMDHGKESTYPTLAVPMFYVRKEHAVDAARAVLMAQRDLGDRTNRKHARLKYVVHEKGLAFFRKAVEAHLNKPVEEPKAFTFTTLGDPLGWHEQGDGRWFCGVRVENGRVADFEKVKYRSALRALAQRFNVPMRFTANQNVIFMNLNASDQTAFEALLLTHGLPAPERMTAARRMSVACVALPTCHLALSESERAFPAVMDGIDGVLRELGLSEDEILFRMTGCPNGCARPYNADIAFVGRGAGKYALYVGGSRVGDRLASLHLKSINVADVPAKMREMLGEYVKSRKPGESFTNYWGRTHPGGEKPHPSQFHVEYAERAKRLAGGSASAGDAAPATPVPAPAAAAPAPTAPAATGAALWFGKLSDYHTADQSALSSNGPSRSHGFDELAETYVRYLGTKAGLEAFSQGNGTVAVHDPATKRWTRIEIRATDLLPTPLSNAPVKGDALAEVTVDRTNPGRIQVSLWKVKDGGKVDGTRLENPGANEFKNWL